MKYQSLYDILNKFKGIMVDLDTGRVVINGYGVIAESSYPGYSVAASVAQKDGEAFDTMVERAIVGTRNLGANHLLVLTDDDLIAFTPMNRALNKEFALGWASAFEHDFIWNVEKRRPIRITSKLQQGFWSSTPAEVIAVGDKSG